MREAHRDVLADFKAVSSVLILASLPTAAPGSPSTVVAAGARIPAGLVAAIRGPGQAATVVWVKWLA